MKVRRLSRRTILRGIGGVAVALPALELMQHVGFSSRARAGIDAPPGRFVISYGGISTGADGTSDDLLVPPTVGAGYEIRRATQPIADLGIQQHVSIVSGLTVPFEDGDGIVPPGGRSRYYHYNTGGPQTSGMRGSTEREWYPSGPSADQILGASVGAGTTFPVLAYRVQPRSYVGTSEIGSSGRLSFYRDGDGSIRAVDPIVSPRLAYESLFTGFVPTDPAEAARAVFELRRRRSVLDLVRTDTEALLPRLGGVDRVRLERHFDEIRGLETRLDAIDPTGGSCALIPDPGEDPPIGETIIEYEGAGLPYSTSGGYSDEDRRADVLSSLIAMAFACDLSRAASFMLTEAKCYMNMYQLSDSHFEVDMHEGTHQGNQPSVSDAIAWHLRQWGGLVQKLAEMPDVDGSTLLDHTALVLTFEGGYGYDPEGADRSNVGSHSTENMSTFIAGHAGGLAGGRHVRTSGLHPANVVLTAMQSVGHDSDSLGEVSGGISELLG